VYSLGWGDNPSQLSTQRLQTYIDTCYDVGAPFDPSTAMNIDMVDSSDLRYLMQSFCNGFQSSNRSSKSILEFFFVAGVDLALEDAGVSASSFSNRMPVLYQSACKM
jgi:hypothetical protein